MRLKISTCVTGQPEKKKKGGGLWDLGTSAHWLSLVRVAKRAHAFRPILGTTTWDEKKWVNTINRGGEVCTDNNTDDSEHKDVFQDGGQTAGRNCSSYKFPLYTQKSAEKLQLTLPTGQDESCWAYRVRKCKCSVGKANWKCQNMMQASNCGWNHMIIISQ